MQAFDAVTGRSTWDFDLVADSLFAADGTVYATDADKGAIHALAASTGKRLTR
ncbi:hypothetical protein NKH77_50410 [Streptomyces sp. M19]